MAITSLALSSMCSCTWLQSSPPPPQLRACCYSSTQLSVLKTLTHIHSSGVIACLRANSTELALKAARAALSGGISVLEIVMSTPGVFEVLQQLVQEHPTTTLGIQSENISPKEHQQLYYLMPYLIRRQLVKIISMKYVDLHTLQLCKAMKH